MSIAYVGCNTKVTDWFLIRIIGRLFKAFMFFDLLADDIHLTIDILFTLFILMYLFTFLNAI